jgi:hypothetical protein
VTSASFEVELAQVGNARVGGAFLFDLTEEWADGLGELDGVVVVCPVPAGCGRDVPAQSLCESARDLGEEGRLCSLTRSRTGIWIAVNMPLSGRHSS